LAERCAIYARANSLLDPSDEIAGHVEACESYLLQSGWKFTTTCVDFGPANKPAKMRGGFRSLLDEAAQGGFDILLVHDTSHISTNVRALRSFARQLSEANVQVIEVSPANRISRQQVRATKRSHLNVQSI
jgi:DNA invertase Pin-like site-specific DNA recombinase